MDTSKMLHLEKLDSSKTSALLAQSEELKNIAANLFDLMDRSFIRNQIVEVVEAYYDLGKVLDVYEIFGGYVNRSFGIYAEKDGKKSEYFIRKYKIDITEKEIQFEHRLINFSIANGLDIAAGPISTNDGKTYVKVAEGPDNNKIDRYFAVYRYLPGEDKYTWVDNVLTSEEYASSAEVLATFHNATRNFDPAGLERVELKIMELLPTLPDIFKGYANSNINNAFHQYYLRNLDSIIDVINKTRITEEDLVKMPLNPVHCDYHPGNLKFLDNKAVGLFDFDWSKIDLRLFDLGLGLVYFCSSWIDEQDGKLRLDAVETFLQAYQRKLKELNGLTPLNETEKQYLPEILAAGNMYLIFWCLRSYYAEPENLNVYEYLTYLNHQVKCMNWIENHREDILKMAARI